MPKPTDLQNFVARGQKAQAAIDKLTTDREACCLDKRLRHRPPRRVLRSKTLSQVEVRKKDMGKGKNVLRVPGYFNMLAEPAYELAVKLYVFRWNRPELPGRKGKLCRVLSRGKLNSCLIEFTDGFRAVVSRNALRVYRGES